MNDLPFKYGNKITCDKGCNEVLVNQHFLDCPLVNSKKNEVDEYKKILNGSMDEKIITLRKFQEEQKQRKKTLWDSVSIY